MNSGVWIALFAVAVIAAVLVWSRGRFVREAGALRAALAAAPKPLAMNGAVPAPVRDMALRNGVAETDLARRVEFDQEVGMRLKPGAGWQPMQARQWIAAGATMFFWEAAAPPKFRVMDAYVDGRGLLSVLLFGVLNAMRARGADVDRGEAMRYLAELPWCPDAMVGNPALRWRMEAGEAVAELDLPDGPAAARFVFDAEGDIVTVRVAGRPTKGPGGQRVLRDWEGYFAEYAWLGGRRIPTRAEVGYVGPDGAVDPYFQCQVTGYTPIH